MRVLLSAYACDPTKGSEPGIGWNVVRQAARFHEVWVLTREGNREPIERALEEAPLPNVHWVYHELPPRVAACERLPRGAQMHYYLWQLSVYRLGRRLHARLGFDVVHHATIGVYWMPSFLALLGVPFVWGPVGGGEGVPRAFRRSLGVRGRLYEALRGFVQGVGCRDPFVRVTARRARAALATTPETAARMRRLGARSPQLFSQVALAEHERVRLGRAPFRAEGPFRVASVGVLQAWKGFHLGLAAFARLAERHPGSEYWIVGDGPDRARLARLARELGVQDRVRFRGMLPRGEALEALAECDVLVHPSLHEAGGWVCTEAMAAGRPVVCLDLHGPALQVTPETGFKVPARSVEQAVGEMADALLRLARSPGLRARMGEAGRRRVEECFNWETNGRRLDALYRREDAPSPCDVPQLRAAL